MKRKVNILIPLLAIGVVLFVSYEGLGWKNNVDSFISNLVKKPAATIEDRAWQVLEEYMSYAKAHDLEGVRRLSAELSETCTNEATREECYALMDSVYAFFSYFRQEDFKNSLTNGEKIILFTDNDGGVRIAYFFTIEDNGAIKVAGMRFCKSSGTMDDQCSEL